MGRALLIICLGSFIILGIVQHAVNNRSVSVSGGNVETFYANHGQNMAGSALEMAINRMNYDNSWESHSQPWIYSLDEDMDAHVRIDEHDDFPDEVPEGYYRVRSEVQVEDKTLEAFAFLLKNSVELPEIESALGVYGSGSTINFSGAGGNKKMVSGFDKNPDGSDGPAEALPGISSPDEEDDLINISGGSIPYEGDPDYLQRDDMDSEELDRIVEEYRGMGRRYESESDFGTPESPSVIIIGEKGGGNNQDVKISGSSAHYGGIIVVEAGSSFTMSGNSVFEGLIIVYGTFEAAAGTPYVYGGVILGDNAKVEIDQPDFDLQGNPTVHYSSQSLQNLQDNITGGGSSGSMVVDRIFY